MEIYFFILGMKSAKSMYNKNNFLFIITHIVIIPYTCLHKLCSGSGLLTTYLVCSFYSFFFKNFIPNLMKFLKWMHDCAYCKSLLNRDSFTKYEVASNQTSS